jgi:nucleotide-binding universal stress UspA family protein
MKPIIIEEPPSKMVIQTKKILIAVDLGINSESTIAYSLLVTQRLTCEYSLVYCLDNGISAAEAQEKIDFLINQINQKYNHYPNHSLKTIISDGSPIEAIKQLNEIHHYNCIMVGSSNLDNSWEMGSNSSAILHKIPAPILVIPPNLTLAIPNNISVLIDYNEKSNLENLSGFNNFVAYDNIFINFIFFAKNNKIIEAEKNTIEKFQSFFESNFTFAFIIEEAQTYQNFFKYLEETYCMASVINWDEKSEFHRALLHKNFAKFPCSPKIPVLYTK